MYSLCPQSSLPGLQEKARTFRADIDKFDLLIEQLQSHKTSLRHKVAALTQEASERGMFVSAGRGAPLLA
jgi:hypothetical protein